MVNLRICGKFFLATVVVLSISIKADSRNFFSPYNSKPDWSSAATCLSHPGAVPQVQEFDRVEIGFFAPSVIEKWIDSKVINPFDPDQISVVAEFTNGIIRDTVFGFYYRGYERNQSTIVSGHEYTTKAAWVEDYSPYNWRVRYTPREPGKWVASIKFIVPHNHSPVYLIDPLPFEVSESDKQGFLATGNDQLHFIESNNRKSFFLLGQDIAWPDGERFRGGVNKEKPYLVAGGFMDIQDWTVNLAKNGGNTIRVVNVPWSYEFEWDTVGVYDMEHAWELDTLFRTCEAHNVKIVFCMEHGTYTVPRQNEEHMDWRKHPYNRFLPGIDSPDDFLRDSLARRKFKNKLRYFFARWGYSTSLGVFQLVSEMEHWSYEGAPLNENSEAQALQWEWHTRMLEFAKQQVKYRPLLTSTSYGEAPRNFNKNVFSSPYVDVVCPRHCYFTERYDNLRRFGEVNRVSLFEKGIHEMFPEKPAIIDEMGFGSNGADPNDMDANSDITFHNSLWATSFSGTAGAGLYWWRWGSNQYREQNFPALSTFFSEVDFENVSFTRPGHWEDANRASKVRIETFYLNSADAQRSHCIGWVHNASYWWGNMVNGFRDRDGKSTIINSRTGDDATVSQPTELKAGTKFEIHDLANGAKYELAWFNARGAGGQSGFDQFRTNIFGTAKIEWRPGEADWGYQIVRNDSMDPAMISMMLPADTVYAGETIVAYGNHPLDDGTFIYHWDFGNGTEDTGDIAETIYAPGVYQVRLTCTGASGERHAMTQKVCAVSGFSLAAGCRFAERQKAF